MNASWTYSSLRIANTTSTSKKTTMTTLLSLLLLSNKKTSINLSFKFFKMTSTCLPAYVLPQQQHQQLSCRPNQGSWKICMAWLLPQCKRRIISRTLSFPLSLSLSLSVWCLLQSLSHTISPFTHSYTFADTNLSPSLSYIRSYVAYFSVSIRHTHYANARSLSRCANYLTRNSSFPFSLC